MSVFVFANLGATPKARKAQVEVGAVGALHSQPRNVLLAVVAVVFLVEFADPGAHFRTDFFGDLFGPDATPGGLR